MLNEIDLLEIVLAYDDKGQIIYGNKKAHSELGYAESFNSLSLHDIFVDETGAEVCFSDLNKAQELTNLVAYRKNRTCFPAFVRIIPRKNENEENYLLAFNMMNQFNLEKEISALKSETIELNKSWNEFIANMTHELRTPVNGIKGHISAMLRDSRNASERKTYSIIKKCCEDMSYIINNILDYSKLEAGKFEFINDIFDLYELLNHIVQTNLALVNEKGIRIILNIAENVPREIYGDSVRIGQILNNLVSNAVKFTEIGYVSIDVNKHEQFGDEIELFFLVRDTGVGIEPEQMDKLFKSFSQIDGSSTRKHGGTGLGLIIARELISHMGGSIQVESTPGKGSVFSFNIHLNVINHDKRKTDNEERLADRPSQLSGYDLNFYNKMLQDLTRDNSREIESMYIFGTADNIDEVMSKCNVLILAIELEAWAKAEIISLNLKRLLNEGPEDIKKLIFRLGMSIRKEEDEKSRNFYKLMIQRLEEEYAR